MSTAESSDVKLDDGMISESDVSISIPPIRYSTSVDPALWEV